MFGCVLFGKWEREEERRGGETDEVELIYWRHFRVVLSFGGKKVLSGGWWGSWRHARPWETSALSEEVMWSKEPPEKVKQKETPTLANCNLPWGPRVGSGQSRTSHVVVGQVLHMLLCPAESYSRGGGLVWRLVSTPLTCNSSAEILTPKVTVFGGGTSGRWLGHESALINVISTLIREVMENSPTLSTMWDCTEKIPYLGSGFSAVTSSARPLMLDSTAFRAVRNSLVPKPPRWWFFIVAAQMDWGWWLCCFPPSNLFIPFSTALDVIWKGLSYLELVG